MTRFAGLDDILFLRHPAGHSGGHPPNHGLMRQRHHQPGRPDDFRLRDLTEISPALASTSQVMTNFLLVVALISLVVASGDYEHHAGVGDRAHKGDRITWQSERGRRIFCGNSLSRRWCFVWLGIVGILLGRASSVAIRSAALAHDPSCPPSSLR
jgi:hypothetical protein